MKQGKTTLGKIVRSFKAHCTRMIHEKGDPSFGWQRSYYDHVIRDDVDRFFIEQYIELNPIMWEMDVNNRKARGMSDEALRKYLKEEHGLDGFVLERVIDYELGIDVLT